MLEVVFSNRFKKDLKLAAKRGCDLSLLEVDGGDLLLFLFRTGTHSDLFD